MKKRNVPLKDMPLKYEKENIVVARLLCLQDYPRGYGTDGNASVWGNDSDACLQRIVQKAKHLHEIIYAHWRCSLKCHFMIVFA